MREGTTGILIPDEGDIPQNDDDIIEIEMDDLEESESDRIDRKIKEHTNELIRNLNNMSITSTTLGGVTPTGLPFNSPFTSAIVNNAYQQITPNSPTLGTTDYRPPYYYQQQQTPFNLNGFNQSNYNNLTNTTVTTNIDFSKRILFCSMYDTIICSNYSWQGNNFIPNIPINNITDIYIRREVLDKLKKFVPDIIYIIVPKQFFIQISNSSSLELRNNQKDLNEDIINLTGYFKMYISSYLRLSTSRKCQFMLFDDMDYRSIASVITETINNLNLNSENKYEQKQYCYIGAFSGANGYNATDSMVANEAKIDFIDTNYLLRN